MKTYSTFLLYLPSICILKVLMFCNDLDYCKVLFIPSFCICCSYMLFVNCFIYYVTKMLDWLEQITLIYSTVVAKYITSYNLFVIIDICHIIHMLLQSLIFINIPYIYTQVIKKCDNKDDKCSFGFVILCEILRVVLCHVVMLITGVFKKCYSQASDNLKSKFYPCIILFSTE